MQMFKAILAALTLYLIFLIQQLPANQALSWVSLPANVQISGVSGTVWDGKTQLAVINGMPVRDVRWQLSALPLLWGEASLRIKAGNARDSQQLTFNGELALSASSVSATDLTLFVPASMALANVPLPVPVDADGRFKVAIEQAQWQGKCVALSGQGDWLNAAVNLCACLDGSKCVTSWLRMLVQTHSSCIELPCLGAFIAKCINWGYCIAFGHVKNAH